MFYRALVVLTLLMLMAAPTLATKVSMEGVRSNDQTIVSFRLSNEEVLKGLAVPLKFGEKGSNILCDKVSFTDSRVGYIAEKNAIIDNDQKTILLWVIPMKEGPIQPGKGLVATFYFSGEEDPEIEIAPVGRVEKMYVVNANLKNVDFEFEAQVVSDPKSPLLPTAFSLSQNYPNPFNPETNIEYALPKDSQVTLIIYNILGQKVITLVDEHQIAGYKKVIWNGRDENGQEIASGAYFYRLKAGDFSQTRKMLMLK